MPHRHTNMEGMFVMTPCGRSTEFVSGDEACSLRAAANLQSRSSHEYFSPASQVPTPRPTGSSSRHLVFNFKAFTPGVVAYHKLLVVHSQALS